MPAAAVTAVRSVAPPAGDEGSRLPTCTVTFVASGFTSTDDFLDEIQEVSVDRVADEVVRCEQPQEGSVLDGVEGAYPCVELLRRQIDFQMIETAFPG